MFLSLQGYSISYAVVMVIYVKWGLTVLFRHTYVQRGLMVIMSDKYTSKGIDANCLDAKYTGVKCKAYKTWCEIYGCKICGCGCGYGCEYLGCLGMMNE
jgi:hypothetical protein